MLLHKKHFDCAHNWLGLLFLILPVYAVMYNFGKCRQTAAQHGDDDGGGVIRGEKRHTNTGKHDELQQYNTYYIFYTYVCVCDRTECWRPHQIYNRIYIPMAARRRWRRRQAGRTDGFMMNRHNIVLAPLCGHIIIRLKLKGWSFTFPYAVDCYMEYE